jgi:hypothetical protein
MCKLCTGSASLSERKRARRELFAIWLELRTDVGVSVLFSAPTTFVCIISLSFSLFIPLFPFQALGDVGRCVNACVHKNDLLCAFILVNCLFRLCRSNACSTLDPSIVAWTATFRAACVENDEQPSRSTVRQTVSRVKHHQEEAEASCPGSESLRRG